MKVEKTGDGAWTVRYSGNRYDLAFVQGALRNTYIGPDVPGDILILQDHHQNLDRLRETRPEAAIYIGSNRDRIVWDEVREGLPDRAGLALELRSPELQANLEFQVDDETGALLRRTCLQAIGANPVDVRGALSFSVIVGEPVLRMTYLTGAWGHETQVRSVVPDWTSLQLESRSGKTGFEFQPYLAAETASGTIVVELFWSGNWHIHARTRASDAIIAGGLPEAGFQFLLQPGEEMTLPDAIILRAQGNLDAATRKLHDFRRSLQIADVEKIPVQFNSWYPYLGNPTAGEMIELANLAKDMGCETFVLDAGWYTNDGNTPIDDLWHSTGDWAVHSRRFPRGLEELSDHCHRIGIGFGIWFEPEGIGAAAQLRQSHPEWMHWVNGQPPDPAKRAILNLGFDGAREFARDRMLAILRRTDADWVKWDFNADLISGGWSPDTPAHLRARDPVFAHIEGVYRLQAEIREAMPGIIVEMCASGGGRFDGRLLCNAHVNWMSDQWQAVKNLSIHFGSHLAHQAKLCNDFLIDWPKPAPDGPASADPSLEWHWDARGDVKFRLLVAMLGPFGLSSKLHLWTEDELATARAHIAWYKANARPVIENGDQYMLTAQPPLSGQAEWAAIWYAAKDGTAGAGFFFRLANGETLRRFPLAGLRPDGIYQLITPDGAECRLSGALLAEGLSVNIAEPFAAFAISARLVFSP